MSIWSAFKKAFGIEPVSIEELNRKALKAAPQKQPSSKASKIEVTPEYQEILAWLKAKAPIVFVTGKAGTGKTTLIRYLKDAIRGSVVVVAPTGVAALHVNGTTIHSFFRFPPRVVTDDDIKLVSDRKLYRKMELLIIDEISMVRSEIIDAIDQFLQLNRESSEPFGGVQVLLVGDLFQLPPVVNQREKVALQQLGYESAYFFSAKILKRCQLISKELTRVYRQADEGFINMLNRIRSEENLDVILPILNRRFVADAASKNIITLTCTNAAADEINNKALGGIAGNAHTFKGVVSGNFIVDDDKLPAPLNLALKVNSQVMFTKNDDSRRWVNGTLGRVVGFEDDAIRVEVQKANGTEVFDVQKVAWESYSYKYDPLEDRIAPVKTGSYVQYPLMLAWAVTIHKSQGKTLDKIRIDLGHGAFAYGQAYVALSRCRALEDIYLAREVRKEDVRCDPVIKRFYSALMGDSTSHTAEASVEGRDEAKEKNVSVSLPPAEVNGVTLRDYFLKNFSINKNDLSFIEPLRRYGEYFEGKPFKTTSGAAGTIEKYLSGSVIQAKMVDGKSAMWSLELLLFSSNVIKGFYSHISNVYENDCFSCNAQVHSHRNKRCVKCNWLICQSCQCCGCDFFRSTR